MKKCKITFLPDKKSVEAAKGQHILSAAISAGIYINSSCGGDGVCGRCKILIKKGDYRTEPTGRISQDEKKKGYVLACLTSVQGDLTVEVPPESRLDLAKVSEEDSRFLRLRGIYSQAEDVEKGESLVKKGVFSHSPLATKVFLKLPKPTLEDNLSDLDRVYREIRKGRDIPVMQTGLANIKRLGGLLRDSDWKVTATLGKRNETTEIVLIEAGDTSKNNYGVAFDIGTTTVSGQLVDLNTKKVLASKATHNAQAVFGSDVITRIIYASEGDGLERLHHAVIDNMNAIIKAIIDENKINMNNITGVMCAGNTTMVHLLLRLDPTYIRREPYIPTANTVPVIRAAEAGIKINPRGLLECVPGVSTYVGGDITAGVLASGMDMQDKLTLLIDVGTNGEIVLGNKEWLVCCSASAGPAFEGSGVACGMRATQGAIQRVEIGDKLDPKLTTIGEKPPRGICGSGYIDALAELFLHGIMNRDGKIDSAIKTDRIRDSEFGKEFVLAFKKDAGAERDVVITEQDIENLKRSKGAIFAAASILLKKLSLKAEDIENIYIAGGFGTYLNIEKAIAIGLLPDLDRKKFSFIGNSSLAGAREILLSYDAMRDAERIAAKMTYMELSVEPSYMDEYVSSLFFPHTDIARFPSVKIKRGA